VKRKRKQEDDNLFQWNTKGGV